MRNRYLVIVQDNKCVEMIGEDFIKGARWKVPEFRGIRLANTKFTVVDTKARLLQAVNSLSEIKYNTELIGGF